MKYWPMNSFKKFITLSILFCFGMCKIAFADQYVMPTSANPHFGMMNFVSTDVHHFIGCYGYISSIIFDTNERIMSIKMGDSSGWQFVVEDNKLWLKPILPDADTNAIITTSAPAPADSLDPNGNRVYHFALHAIEVENEDDENLFYEVKIIYPEVDDSKTLGGSASGGMKSSGSGPVEWDSIPDVERDAHLYNHDYVVLGDSNIMPTLIFDDGKFTYFKYGNTNKVGNEPYPAKALPDIAAAFGIDSSGHEFMLNRKFIKDFLVVESVESAFSLVSGDDRVCVFNLKLPFDYSKVKRLRKLGLLD